MSTTIERQTIQLLTPALLAGADRERPEWRGASLHGQLHFWARVLAHDERDPHKVRAGEARLMGGFVKDHGKLVPWAAPFAVWLEGEDNPAPAEYPNCPHDPAKGRRRGLAAGALADLRWSARPSKAWSQTDAAANARLSQDIARLLRAWVLVGALGQRANRAAGSVWIPDWSPTAAEFTSQVCALCLPPEVEVRLLPAVDSASIPRRLRNHPPEEQLRGIATDTIRLRKDEVGGNPLGYAGEGSERKASPLKFKLGRLSDGLRLIAVHDNRHGRGGHWRDVIDALRGKPLGELLQDAAILTSSATPSHAAPPRAASPVEAVGSLLSGRFDYPAIERYGNQVQAWIEAGHLDLVAEFLRQTQEPQYRGLRQQPWYAKASAAVSGVEETIPGRTA